MLTRLRSKFAALTLSLLALASCAGNNPPPSLSPAGVRAWQANRVVVELITIQRTAIALNELTICPDQQNPSKCFVALSEQNTRIVIDACEDAGLVLRASPEGWKIVGQTVVNRVRQRLDERGHEELDPYLDALAAVLESLSKRRY